VQNTVDERRSDDGLDAKASTGSLLQKIQDFQESV
jgi:hypothetical protein